MAGRTRPAQFSSPAATYRHRREPAIFLCLKADSLGQLQLNGSSDILWFDVQRFWTVAVLGGEPDDGAIKKWPDPKPRGPHSLEKERTTCGRTAQNEHLPGVGSCLFLVWGWFCSFLAGGGGARNNHTEGCEGIMISFCRPPLASFPLCITSSPHCRTPDVPRLTCPFLRDSKPSVPTWSGNVGTVSLQLERGSR